MSTAVLPADVLADAQPLEPVWNVVAMFGEHKLYEWTGPASEAPSIETAWTRQHGSLRIISRVVPDVELAAKAGVEWT